MGLFSFIWLVMEAGRRFLRGPFFVPIGEFSIRFHLGLTIVVPFILAIGLWSTVAASFMVGAAGLVAFAVLLPQLSRGRRLELSSNSPMDWIGLSVSLTIVLITAVGICAPITSWDATVAHLSVPAAYERAGRIGLSPGNVYSAYPQLVHVLVAVSSEGGVECWLLSGISVIAMGGLGARLGGRSAGIIAAALFASSPIFIAQAQSVAIDVPFAGFVASALTALIVWSESRNARYLIAAGAIAGASCGIRHSGYVAALLMLAWVAIEARGNRAKSFWIFAAAAFMASAPWWLRSWILVGNPVYPLMTSVFGDGGMPDVQVTAPLQHGTARGFGVLDFVVFPWRITMHPDAFDGWQASPGALIVPLGVVGVLFGGRMARWLGGFSLAGVVTMYMVQRFARYLFPFLAPLHATAALVATRPGPLKRPIAALLVFTYIYGLGLAVGTTYFKWPVVFGFESRRDYLIGRVERYPAFEWINEYVPENAAVLTLDPRSYFIQRDSFQNLAAIAQLGGKPIEEQLGWMGARRIRYILIPDAYVAGSPVFREWGILPLIEQWRGDARFRVVYDADLPDVRGGGTEHVTILEVVSGDGDGAA